MSKATAKIIADSIAPTGKRITTMSLRYWRMVHAELMTHRQMSRNASSSRAIPVKKLIEQVEGDPAGPIYWGSNKPGMQAGEELTGNDLTMAQVYWEEGRQAALKTARNLADLGVHKQIVNRVLEPYSFISVIVTATEWDNFFALRLHPDAQPEIQDLAGAMIEAYMDSTPVARGVNEWHLPYVSDEEREAHPIELLRKLSTARCARVSYLTHEGKAPEIDKDIILHDRLAESGHWSPFEHQALAMYIPEMSGNFCGWWQYRKTFKDEVRSFHYKR